MATFNQPIYIEKILFPTISSNKNLFRALRNVIQRYVKASEPFSDAIQVILTVGHILMANGHRPLNNELARVLS